jgi:hypothetical protein
MAETIELKRGDTFEYIYEIVDDATEDPYPLADLYFRSQVKNASKKTVHSMDSDAIGGLAVDEVASTVTVTIPPEVTETFLVQKHSTDLEVTFPSGYRISTDTVVIKVKEDQTT